MGKDCENEHQFEFFDTMRQINHCPALADMFDILTSLRLVQSNCLAHFLPNGIHNPG
jgi:hypothetical protein